MMSFVESTNDKVKTHLANGFKAMKKWSKNIFQIFHWNTIIKLNYYFI